MACGSARLVETMLVPITLEGSEWLIVIVIVVVIIFGASKIPDLAKSLGRASGEFRKGKVKAELEVRKMKAAAAYPASKPTSDSHTKLMKDAEELGVQTGARADADVQADIKKALGLDSPRFLGSAHIPGSRVRRWRRQAKLNLVMLALAGHKA
jgi:sec-independent protein translocase protein TatA